MIPGRCTLAQLIKQLGSSMTDYRKDDLGRKTYFRTKRLYQENGQWYFFTREGTMEGPFQDKVHALKMLDNYIRVMKSDFAPTMVFKMMEDGELPGRLK